MVTEEFRTTPIYTLPILVSLLVSILCTALILQSRVNLDSVTILPETGYGPLFNAAIFVLAAGFGATMIYLLLRRGVHRLLHLLMGTAFSVLSFSLVILYSELVFIVVDIEVPILLIFALAFAITVLIIREVFLKKGGLRGIILLVIGGAIGTLLGASIPFFSAILILLLLAVYDVYAVFRGPVGKIVAKGLEHLPGASFAFKRIHVGLGDLTFYSMLVSRMLLSLGWESCIAATLGVLLGAFLSFKMVERKGMFPGLPFPIVLGLLAAFTIELLM